MRLLTILGAYVAANAAAAVVLTAGLAMAFRLRLAGAADLDPIDLSEGAMSLGVFVAVAVMGLVSIPPALAVIAYAEHRRIRSRWFYAAAGAIIGMLALAFCISIFASGADEPNGDVGPATAASAMLIGAALSAAAGGAGGLTYWVIAARPLGVSP
jgi:hypothetical protein